MMSFKNISAFLLSYFLSFTVEASIDRLSSIQKDMGRVEKVYLNEGLVSLIEFPDRIVEVRIGNSRDFKVTLSEVNNKELTIFLSKGNSNIVTNLLVRSGTRLYVFDLISSKIKHQDYVKVVGGYGGPKYSKGSSGNPILKERVTLGGGK